MQDSVLSFQEGHEVGQLAGLDFDLAVVHRMDLAVRFACAVVSTMRTAIQTKARAMVVLLAGVDLDPTDLNEVTAFAVARSSAWPGYRMGAPVVWFDPTSRAVSFAGSQTSRNFHALNERGRGENSMILLAESHPGSVPPMLSISSEFRLMPRSISSFV